ncbi:MAG: penicillin-binding protein 2, partial [Pseudomonadota bacterium]
MSQNRDSGLMFDRRAMVLAGAGGVIWTTLLARLFQLQVVDGQRYADLAAENGVKLDLAPPRRGRIFDRFGRPLAVHRQAGRISMVREQVPDMDATLSRIANHIELTPERRERIIARARSQAAFVPTIVAEDLTYEDFARMTVKAADPGFEG